MGLVSLTGFSGTAEVLGLLREIEWNEDDGLVIHGLRQDDAHNVLNKLAINSLPSFVKNVASENAPPPGPPGRDVTVRRNAVPAPDKAEAKKTETNGVKYEKAGPDGKEAKPTGTLCLHPVGDGECLNPLVETAVGPFCSKGHDQKAPPKHNPVPKSPATTAEPLQEKQLALVPPKEEPEPVTTVPSTPPPAEESDDGGRGYSLDALRRASTLRPIFAHLMERGFTTRDKLIAVCKELKDQVPVLSRVRDIEDRVDRVLEVMGNAE